MRNSVWRPVQRAVGFGQATPSPRSALGFIKKLLNDWSLDFGSLLAYVFVIALLPIAIAVFGIFALVFRANPGVRQNIIDGIVNSLQDNNTKTAVRQITNIAADNLESNAGGILAVGIVFSILGGSRLFVAIDNVFTIIYRTQTRSFIAQNLLSIGMLILFIILIIITFGASGAPSFLINTLPNQNGAQFGIFAAGIAISIFTSFILFILIYLIIPNRKMKLKHTWLGALIGAILLDIFIVLFPLYIRRFMGSFIGLIGFAIILITFFYYFSIIIILGAQINAYFSDRIQPLPEDLGTVLSQAVSRIIKITTTRPIFNTVQYPRSIRSRPYY
ncbi:unnamed protein product [Rotaria magnacalcarata]|uniref:YihY/virulence factor BrkB family protein n=1 Tax=Rotaria magnacalcarata TaxID=392030 RepID=A0A816QC59_9BILA|nr:unnamed protein product [Rotaria magnacalcarata]CAF1434486.1 unnamed protein product [Rotaria magnacalcarata]CAF2058218.1 unnamed protein product [Rotaria magnacalcarata]CAF2121619.1 unnamed protein product [Rotaria magnacalcarata]CAF2225253.1 unnamed protein product [Rotaria magnacalcarata]